MAAHYIAKQNRPVWSHVTIEFLVFPSVNETIPWRICTWQIECDIYFTSESVTEGHPDKMADQISDAVLDAVMAEDPMGRVACEVLVTTGICVVAGEITTTTYVDVPKLARTVIHDIGYTDAEMGFDSKTCGVLNTIQSQSPDIAMGVDTGGAGDQGLMFGYACDETRS